MASSSTTTTANIEEIEVICDELKAIRQCDIITVDSDSQQRTMIEELKSIAAHWNLENDEQTKILLNIVAMSTGNASASDANRFKHYVETVALIRRLIGVIKREIKGFHELTTKFDLIVQKFTAWVLSIQRTARLTKIKLEHSTLYLETIEKILKRSLSDDRQAIRTLDDNEQNAILECLTTLCGIAQDFIDSGTEEMQKLADFEGEVNEINTMIQTKKGTVTNRTGLVRAAAIGGGVGIPVGVGAVVASPLLGGVGALVLTGAGFFPIAAAILCIGGGLVVVGGLAALIRYAINRFSDHQKRAEGFLSAFEQNITFMLTSISDRKQRVDESIDWCTNYKLKLKPITQSVANPVFLQENQAIFAKAREAATKIISSLEELCNFDFVEWNRNIKALDCK